jgi:hypothetical protein
LTPPWGGKSEQEWVKTLEDGRKVKFIYQDVLTKAKNPLSHEDVESHFKGELSKT